MVHALRRAHRMVKPSGCVVDIHPAADLAVMLAGDSPAGVVESDRPALTRFPVPPMRSG